MPWQQLDHIFRNRRLSGRKLRTAAAHTVDEPAEDGPEEDEARELPTERGELCAVERREAKKGVAARLSQHRLLPDERGEVAQQHDPRPAGKEGEAVGYVVRLDSAAPRSGRFRLATSER